jgi:16S rRNA (adenine1518-N6/adenine1519-N6)-dimethyltransferase
MKRRSLGQHYLVDSNISAQMVRLAGIRQDDTVLEIGTGRGALTQRLVGVCGKLEAYEIDRENFIETKRAVKAPNLSLHLADAFEEARRFDVLVSSVPYSRSADFVEWLSQMSYRRAVVLLQEDFVKKVLAEPGDRNYRAISVIGQVSARVTIERRVGKGAFRPQPKVSSAIVSFDPHRTLSPGQIANIKALFALRRRTVSSALSTLGSPGNSEDPTARVFQLDPDEVLDLISRSSKPNARDLSSQRATSA